MAVHDRAEPRAAAELLSPERALLCAALLSGHGRDAAPLARRLAHLVHGGGGRSCLEAGAPLQLLVEAPGPPRLSVGVRVGDTLEAGALHGLVNEQAAREMHELLKRLPPAQHPSLGTWLLWSRARQSLHADLRDPAPLDALARLKRAVSPEQCARLALHAPSSGDARPWALALECDEAGRVRVFVQWLLSRRADPATLARALAPGGWPSALEALTFLLRRPAASGRWVITTALDHDHEPQLRVATTGWSLVPEAGEDKQGALARLMREVDGPCDYAEALFSLCRGAARPDWRVGRACEIRVGARGRELRLFLAPQLQGGASAGTSSSLPTSSTGPYVAEPSSA